MMVMILPSSVPPCSFQFDSFSLFRFCLSSVSCLLSDLPRLCPVSLGLSASPPSFPMHRVFERTNESDRRVLGPREGQKRAPTRQPKDDVRKVKKDKRQTRIEKNE